MKKTALLAVLPFAFANTGAIAGADEAGVQHLTEVFQTYLGTTEGVVKVELDGDAYKVTLDATPLSGMAADAGASFAMTPQVLTLTDNGDGTWAVAQDQSVTITFNLDGKADVTEEIGSIKMNGVFDEALMTFSSAKGSASDIRASQKTTDPQMGDMVQETKIASLTFEMTGTAGATGGVDMAYTSAATGYEGVMNTPASPDTPSMAISYSLESLIQNGTAAGMRPEPIYKTVAWFVANQTDEAKEANVGVLKSALLDGLPIFDLITGDMMATNIKINSPMGEVGIAEVAVMVEAAGAVSEGKIHEAITISGLSLPAGVVPDWASTVLPQKVKFDVEMTGYDARSGVTAALDLLDAASGMADTTEQQDKIKQAFLPNGTLQVGLNPGFISGDGYELTFEGDMTVPVGDMPIPTGTAVVTLTGIEKLQAAIAAAPPDMQGQAMMMMGMAQGMAKPGANGELVWEIDASQPGMLSVNGMPMMGGQ